MHGAFRKERKVYWKSSFFLFFFKNVWYRKTHKFSAFDKVTNSLQCDSKSNKKKKLFKDIKFKDAGWELWFDYFYGEIFLLVRLKFRNSGKWVLHVV